MRIQFLLVTVDHLAGTERAAIAQANALVETHDVEIVSVLRMSSSRIHVDPRVRLRYLTTAQADLAGDVDIVVDRAEELIECPSTLVPRWWDPTLNALCDVALEKFLPSARADVVVTMVPGLLAAAAQRLPEGTALVHQEHRSSMHRAEGGVEILRAFGPRADVLVSLTEVNATWLRELLGAQAPAVRVVPNAAPGREQPRSLLDQPLIVAAGRLDGGKQYPQLVRAFAAVADQMPEWRLRIFGTGNARRAIMGSVRRYGLWDRVELPGVTPDMAAEWAKASISALTSNREGLPLVIQEALAAGVPVVSYDCGTGPSELIEHGVNGYLLPEGDVDALAGHLLELAQDVETRKRMGEAARGSLERYDQGRITAMWEEIYADAVAARRADASPWVTRQLQVPAEDVAASAPIPPAITPAESRHDLMRLTAAALQDVSGWFALPARGDFPPTVVVPAEHRALVLDALGRTDFPDHVGMVVGEEDHWFVRRGSIAEITEALRSALVMGVSIEPWPETGSTTSHLAHRAGVRVEFWSRGRDGALVAPLNNPYARHVAADDLADGTVDGVKVPVIAGMGGPFFDTCPFPIDVVYTWVDDNDPAWQASRRATEEAVDARLQRREASGDARFRNRDELRYSLRSIHAHAPWVRTIHLVTAGQRPSWLSDHPKVRVVDHRDILPAEALPTFNSHAIETALHRVPGLSEQFIYFNDDVFLARPVGPERFFSAGGNFAVFLTQETLGVAGHDDRPFVGAGLNNRKLLESRFGITNTHTVAHTPHPFSKSVLERVCAEFAEPVAQTARSPFRSPTDVSVTASLAQHYGLAVGAAHMGDLDRVFVDTSKASVRRRLRTLSQRETEAFCVGDHHDYALPEDRVSAALGEFFEAYFPVRAPWENDG